MALQLAITSVQGIPAPDGYIKIMDYFGTKDNITLKVWFYYDGNARTLEKQPLYVNDYSAPLTALGSGPFMQELYNYLKTLPEFEGAVDA